MTTRDFIESVINRLEGVFYKIESKYESPEFINNDRYPRFRHKNQSREIAIILKSARMISALYACNHLLLRGFIQEIGVLFRTIDEFNEEIYFLFYDIKNGDLSDQAKLFLDDFYQEEFDFTTEPLLSTQKRKRLPRKKIQSVVGKFLGLDNPHALLRPISSVFSGYVHGAYPQIMEIYGGRPPKYHLNGMLGTPIIGKWQNHLVPYVYRVILCVTLITKEFNLHDEYAEMLALRDEFEGVFKKL